MDRPRRAHRQVTFQANPDGSYTGLLQSKPVTVIIASAGSYAVGTPGETYNAERPYLKQVLGFIGLPDVTFIEAGGTWQVDKGMKSQRRLWSRSVAPAKSKPQQRRQVSTAASVTRGSQSVDTVAHERASPPDTRVGCQDSGQPLSVFSARDLPRETQQTGGYRDLPRRSLLCNLDDVVPTRTRAAVGGLKRTRPLAQKDISPPAANKGGRRYRTKRYTKCSMHRPISRSACKFEACSWPAALCCLRQ